MDNKKIQVSNVVILPTLNKVYKGDTEIRLEPKIMAVLMYLIEHRHQMVSHDTLVQTIWPDTVVGKEVVTRAIFELRKLFEDDARQPQFIETIPKKGYCFIHNIDSLEQPESQTSAHHHVPLIRLILVFSLGLLLILAVWLLSGGATPDNSIRTIIPYSGGMAQNKLAINEDGSSIGFVLSPGSGNTSQVHLINTQTLHQTPLATDTPFNYSVVWLNTQKTWGYVRCTDDICNIYTRKTEDSPEILWYEKHGFVREILSHPVNEQLLIVSITGDGSQLTLLNETTTQLLHEEDFTDLRIERAIFFPTDTRVYFSARDNSRVLKLYEYDWQKGQLSPMPARFEAIRGLTFYQNQLVVSGKYKSKEAIWRITPEEGSVTLWHPAQPSEFLFSPILAPDDTLFYFALKRDTKIQAYGLNKLGLLAKADSNGVEVKAVYVPNEEALLAVSNRTGHYEIWQSDNAGIRRISHLEADLIAQPQLSPFQSSLAFVIQKNSQFQLHLMDTSSNNLRRTYTSDTPFTLVGWLNRDTLLLSVSKENQKELEYFTLNQSSSSVEFFREGQFKLIHNLTTDNTESYFLSANQSLVATQGEDASFHGLSLKNVLDFNAVDTLALYQQQLYVTLRGNPKQFLRIALPTLEVDFLAELPSNGYVSQIGVIGGSDNQQPYVIYDQLQADVTQIIKHSP